MSEHTSVGKELAKEGGRLISHVLALALGVILMIAGTAMGVSLVLLPIGIPLGLIGLAFFLWGLFGQAADKQAPT
jgi:cbb3-type cytochrome oxidase maturation protein